MPIDTLKRTARKILDEKEPKSLKEEAGDYIKKAFKPEVKQEAAPEANAAFGKPEDLLMAIPAFGAAKEAKTALGAAERIAPAVEKAAEYWKKGGKVTRTAKPFAEMAERIFVKGDTAAPRLTKAQEILGKLSSAEKKAMENKGFYQMFKGKKY